MDKYITREELVRALHEYGAPGFDQLAGALRENGEETPTPEPELPTQEQWSYIATSIKDHFLGDIGDSMRAFANRMASGDLVAVPVSLIAQHDGKACVWFAESNRITAERDRLRGELEEARALLKNWLADEWNVAGDTDAFLSRTEKKLEKGET